jgi:flavin reductase (DIM6/NTAB) family NADH-FMN oxidoreductase RutF
LSSTPPANPVDQAEFRKLMSLFATGVCVISFDAPVEGGATSLSGMTINSLVSVSLEPSLVCWSLQNSASQFEQYRDASHFAVSILSDGQEAIARRYAARGDSALMESDFERTSNGLPVIKGALGIMECRRWNAYPAGDHTMILGEVQRVESCETWSADPRGLGFFGGRFLRIGG